MNYIIHTRHAGNVKEYKVTGRGAAIQFAMVWLAGREQTASDFVERHNGTIEIMTKSGVYSVSCCPEESY